VKEDRYSVQDSRSVRSPWVWRAFVIMALVAVGIDIALAGSGARAFYLVAWGIIAAGWMAIGLWLWRQHNKLYHS
jgi:hypothetical protein